MKTILTLLLAVFLFGCPTQPSISEVNDQSPQVKESQNEPSPEIDDDVNNETPRVEVTQTSPAETADCSELTRTSCLKSPNCVLDKEPEDKSDVYVCRAPKNECETNFAKTGTCGPESKCELVPANCYCPCKGYGKTTKPDGEEAELCSCACGGGPPASCKARS